jgi:RNA polymerase sigma factor (sigma-70 family)
VWIYIDSFNIEIIDAKNINNISEMNNNFYEKHNPQIRAIVARILNNANRSQDIDDCVNTVFLAIMEKLQQYNETRGSMGAFLAMITRSVALNYCRDTMRQRGELIGDDKIDLITEPLEIESKIEFQTLVETVAENLSEQENALFTLKYLLFYTPEEIAKFFHIRRNAVDGRLNRLKNKIKNLLIKGGVTI